MSDDEFEFLVRVAIVEAPLRPKAIEKMDKPFLSPLATDVLGGLLGLSRTASATIAWMTEVLRVARERQADE